MASWQDIENRESLEAWLEGQPREVAIAIAARSALRVMPVWADYCETDEAKELDLTPLPVLRCCLISSVAALSPTDEIRTAADTAASSSAAAAEDATAEAAASAADASADAADASSYAADADATAVAVAATAYAADATATTWEAIKNDAREVEVGGLILKGPLWHGENPFLKTWIVTSIPWHQSGSSYAFWHRWYESLLDGTPMNPGLLYKIALIPDDTWDAGPEAVAEAIREIEAEFEEGGTPKPPRARIEEAIAKTPYGERIEINPETGKLRAVPDSDLPDDISDYAARKISGAAGLFNDDPRNQYTALAPELDLLRQALQVEPRLPVELFDVCASVSNRVRIHIETGDLPEPNKDPALADFLARIRDAAADIFAHDPTTRKMVEARNRVLGNDALVDERENVISATNELARISEGVLTWELPKDADIASDVGADPEERTESSYRIVSRIVRIGAWVVGGGTATAASVLAIADSATFARLLEAALRYLGFYRT